mgnify:CR=1 FL=1
MPRRVALRKESVDRNLISPALLLAASKSLSARRAWIEIVNTADQEARKRSLSARRAWIEIGVIVQPNSNGIVALRKESVDRNNDRTFKTRKTGWSLSARRAWIEIFCVPHFLIFGLSLSARRAWIEIAWIPESL